MPSDDGLTPQQREAARREHEAAAMAEMDEMDNVIMRGAEPMTVEAEEPAPIPVVESEEVEEATPEVAIVETEVEPKVADEPAATEPEDEYDFSFINELARNALLQQVPVTPQAQAPTPTQPQPQAPLVAPIATPPQPIAIASLEEMNEAFTSPEKFIELLDKVAMRAEERALLRLPQVARQVSMQVIDHAAAVQEFYNKNPELKQYHDFVGYCARVVESKHPDWTNEQVATETARVAKAQIPALRHAQKTNKSRPALPGAGRTQQRRAASASAGLSALQKEIDEMPNTAF